MSRQTARVIGAGVLALALIGYAVWYARGPGAVARRTSAQIRTSLTEGVLPDDAPARGPRTLALLRTFYERREHRPAWTTGTGPTAGARDLLRVLARAREEGLRPGDYSTAEIAQRLKQGDGGVLRLTAGNPVTLAEFDLLCTIAALRYASDVFDGRISPRGLDAKWHTTPRQDDLPAVISDAVARGMVHEALARLAPTHDGYRQLRKARARYAELVAAGGWPVVPGGVPLRCGDRGPRVALLRQRLVVSGDLAATPDATAATFDRALERAVAAFQARHGRRPTGVVAGPELAALNVPATTRLHQIELNLERWRWLPRSFGERYLWVNIPEYMLHAYEGKRRALSMRVVVGTTDKPTPVFSDALASVVINPVWKVPESIANEELLPALAADPGHLARKGIRVYAGRADGAREIDASAVDWTKPVRYAFRQDPGAHNALGRVKFVLPNQFEVYLHDTPAGHLFQREDRSFSHGCIRVEDPVRLAGYVLRGRPEADPGTVQDLIASGETQKLAPPERLPVHILYFTAFVNDEGILQFREDVYGIDRELVAKLAHAGRRP